MIFVILKRFQMILLKSRVVVLRGLATIDAQWLAFWRIFLETHEKGE